jgi:hypothetical protein
MRGETFAPRIPPFPRIAAFYPVRAPAPLIDFCETGSYDLASLRSHNRSKSKAAKTTDGRKSKSTFKTERGLHIARDESFIVVPFRLFQWMLPLVASLVIIDLVMIARTPFPNSDRSTPINP